MNASSEPIRIGSGSTIEAMPASQQPWIAVIRPRLVGPRMATWSPGPRPRACSAAPTARASSWSWRQDTNDGAPSTVTEAPTKWMPVGASAASSSRSMVEAGRAIRVRHASCGAPPTPSTLVGPIRVFAGIGVFRAGKPRTKHSDAAKHSDGIASGRVRGGARRLGSRYVDRCSGHHLVRSGGRRRRPRPPLHGRPRPGDRAHVAGALGRRGHVRGAQPGRPAGRPRGRRRARRKLFVLDMFPYPSGTGLHVGHPLGFIGTDVYSRYKRMAGRNVLHTMGFDAFGLPAEQYAVQTGTHPAITTAAERRHLPPAAPPPRPEPRPPPLASTPPTPATTAGRSGSSCRSSTPGSTPSGPTRRAARAAPGRSASCAPSSTPAPASSTTAAPGPGCRRPSGPPPSTATAWPTSARRRSTGAPGWARSSPTRRSPPTAAATAATSRSSSATCASG